VRGDPRILCVPALRFRWVPARRNETVLNYSRPFADSQSIFSRRAVLGCIPHFATGTKIGRPEGCAIRNGDDRSGRSGRAAEPISIRVHSRHSRAALFLTTNHTNRPSAAYLSVEKRGLAPAGTRKLR